MAAAENKVARSDEFVEELQTAVARSTMGGVVHAIFEVVGKAMGKNRGGGGAKLVEMMGMTADTKGQVIRGARQVRAQAHAFGVQQHAAGWASTAVAEEWMYKLWKGRAGERTEGEGLAAAMT